MENKARRLWLMKAQVEPLEDWGWTLGHAGRSKLDERAMTKDRQLVLFVDLR